MENLKIDIEQLSPMMKHYLSTKEEYKDCILFYRLGDFYEMFFEDAITVSKALDLTLTKKACGLEEKAPMCGVPFHSADTYINRLTLLGYKVAICEQIEEETNGKSTIFKREVLKVITPGTTAASEVLDDGKNNYIMSIMYMGDDFGVAFSDFSTGEFYICEIDKAYKLMDIINRLSPVEILANEYFLMSGIDISQITKRLNIAVATLPNSSFNEENISEETKKNINFHKYISKKNAISAASALISYMEEMQKSKISHITDIKLFDESKHMILDSFTIRNLELLETMQDKTKTGSLLSVIDKTKTSMGKRLLRNMLIQPLQNVESINNRFDILESFMKKPIDREELREYLSSIFDIERLLTKISCKSANPRDLVTFKYSLQNIPAIKNLLSTFENPLIDEEIEKMDDLNDLYEMIDEMLVDEPPILAREGGLIKDGFCEEIDEYRAAKSNGKDWLSKLEAKEKENTGIKNLRIKYNKVFGYYLEVTNSFKDKVPYDWIRKQTLTNAERYITEDLKRIEDSILGANDKLSTIENELFIKLRDDIAKHSHRIQATASAIAKIDVLSTFARVSEINSYVRPKINLSGKINILSGRHPVIEKMIGSENFVSNNTNLDLGKNSIALITGPNMAGKSTYMRQVAIIVLLAHIGCFVPAIKANISITDRIFTRVGASDDLASGQSTFMMEMNDVANILKSATKNSLLILDEIGRGTGTLDGLSIAQSCVEYIDKKIGAKTLFATHYHELILLEEKIPSVKNYSIAVKENGEDIIFLRKIVEGGADKSYGIHVAALAGVPQAVITRAKEILKELSLEEIGSYCKIDTKQLSFFDIEKDEKEENKTKVIESLKEININKLTPIEALEKLLELQRCVN